MRSYIQTAVLLTSWLAHQASAHGLVTKVVVAQTKTYSGYNPDFQYSPTPVAAVGWVTPGNQETGPILPPAYGSSDIICHMAAKQATLAADVAAGQELVLHWTSWAESHHGPVLDYLALADTDDISKIDKTKLNFFKIAEAGLTDGTKSPPLFAADQIRTTGQWKVKIPANIKAGTYVLRHEIIALHEGHLKNGAQNYPQCITLKVTGGGSETPGGIPATQFYTPNDKGIFFDIYTGKVTSYPIPGPALWSGAGAAPAQGSGSAAPASPVTSAVPSAAPATPVKAATPSEVPAAPAAPAGSDAPSSGSGGRRGRKHKWGKARWWRNSKRHARDLSA